MMNRSKKIEQQNEIFVTAPDYIKFPGLQNKEKNMVLPATFPTNEDIISIIENAKEQAITDLCNIGIKEESSNDGFKINFKCHLSYVRDDSNDIDEDNIDDDLEDDYDFDNNDCDGESVSNVTESDACDSRIEKDLQTLSSMPEELMLKDYSKNYSDNDSLGEEGIFTVIKFSSGKTKVVLKNTLCWLLMEDKHSLSSDRLARLKACNEVTKKKSKTVGNRLFVILTRTTFRFRMEFWDDFNNHNNRYVFNSV